MLNTIDEFTRDCLASGGAPALKSVDVIELLAELFILRGAPGYIRSDNVRNSSPSCSRVLNARDGGINGVKITWEECETKYNTKLGVECYERLKNRGATGASLINPYSTGITYQLIPKASVDKLPIHSMGYGRTAAADGRIFKWTFNFPTTYWSQVSAFVKYVGQQEGGMEALKGKKIALVYHNSPYGKEPIPTLTILAENTATTSSCSPSIIRGRSRNPLGCRFAATVRTGFSCGAGAS
ncbi:hypothetical protein GBAR_LOCUS19563 [Geodia barretti]|uniref:Leucine-binding protein domain-containing protein n=1 Tax=Geodia barretti TaxID=519541 RepID=A0AA35SSE5_GEOBA|nr:hypothetical protein GBAR_LOCUS19563 [Geodia barretti]